MVTDKQVEMIINYVSHRISEDIIDPKHKERWDNTPFEERRAFIAQL